MFLRKKTGVEIRVGEELIESCRSEGSTAAPPQSLPGVQFCKASAFPREHRANPGGWG